MAAFIPLIGRIAVGIPIFMFGLMHMMNANDMAEMPPFGGVAVVYLTGVINLAVGIAYFIGKYLRQAGIIGALLMLSYALGVHLPGLLSAGDNAQLMQVYMSGLLKDLGLMGGALLVSTLAKD